MSLPIDSQARKHIPMARGLLDYFPDALAEVAYVSHCSNEKHNPGEPLHWSKDKSSDHADCLVRHVVERGTVDPDDGLRHSAKAAWRALAMLQMELEAEANLPAVTPEGPLDYLHAHGLDQQSSTQRPIHFGGVVLPPLPRHRPDGWDMEASPREQAVRDGIRERGEVARGGTQH